MGLEENKDDEEIKNDIKWFILSKMTRHRFWVHKHTSIHNLPKGLPDYLRSRKEVRRVIDNLLKDGTLMSKPTSYGLEVSLNIKKKAQIEGFIEERRKKFEKSN